MLTVDVSGIDEDLEARLLLLKLGVQGNERVSRNVVVNDRGALGPRERRPSVRSLSVKSSLHIGAIQIVGDQSAQRNAVNRDVRYVIERRVSGAKVLVQIVGIQRRLGRNGAALLELLINDSNLSLGGVPDCLAHGRILIGDASVGEPRVVIGVRRQTKKKRKM